MANTEIEIIAECAQGFEGKGYLANLLAEGAGKAEPIILNINWYIWTSFQFLVINIMIWLKSLEMKDLSGSRL